jgi:hypothetical protein
MGLLSSFDVPESVAGYLEWVSGILFVNRTLEDWQHFLSRPDLDRSILEQTITHETYHFYQIATTGYLYRFASRLFDEVVSLIGFPVRERNIEKLVENVMSKSSGKLRDLVAELDRPGPQDLTVRDIVESAAYLYEFKAHYPEFGAQSFREQLEFEMPDREYRHAFQIAEERMGDGAFDNFLVVSVLSLCCDDPAEAFHTTVEMVQRSRVVYESYQDLEAILAASAGISEIHPCLGTAAQVAFESGGLAHRQNPIFRQATYDLNCNADHVRPLGLVVDPKVMQDVAVEVVRPIQLRDGAIWIPEAFKKRSRYPDLEARIEGLVVLGAIALKLQGSMGFSRFRRPSG